MMTLNFKKNTWHWKLAMQGGLGRFTQFVPDDNGWYLQDEKGNIVQTYDGDFCQYTRCVLAGAIAVTVMTFLVITLSVLASLFPLGFIYWLYQMISAGAYVAPNPPAVIFMAGVAVAAVGFLGFKVAEHFSNKALYRELARRNGELPPLQPSFLKEAYLKFKEKTCKRVVIQ